MPTVDKKGRPHNFDVFRSVVPLRRLKLRLKTCSQVKDFSSSKCTNSEISSSSVPDADVNNDLRIFPSSSRERVLKS